MGTTDDGNSGPGERVLTDFTASTPDLGWTVVNDGVMGGRSDGDFRVEGEKLFFQGRTNTNGGGFSSIRAPNLALDLSDHDGIRLRVKGDGRRYTWRLSTDAQTRGREIGYWADFDTVAHEWRTVDIPFALFAPRFRGTWLSGPSLDPSTVTGVGLMIYDGRDGPFTLELDRVVAYREREPFSLDSLRWRSRILVVSAPNAEDERYQRQRAEVEASMAEFRDRDLVWVALLDSDGAHAGGRELDSKEVAAVREELKIADGSFAVVLVGKDGTAKRTEDSVAPMREIYAQIDSMPMRQREMRNE